MHIYILMQMSGSQMVNGIAFRFHNQFNGISKKNT